MMHTYLPWLLSESHGSWKSSNRTHTNYARHDKNFNGEGSKLSCF